jgi:hypothetical protein
MKVYTLPILFILTWSLARAGVLGHFDEIARRQEKKPQDKLEFDQQTESFKKSGTCRLYDANGNKEKRKSSPDICESTCGNLSDKVRDTNATASMSCSSLGPEAKERLWMLDPDGDKWSPGGCLCQIPLAEFIIDTVVAALPLIDDVLCVGLTTAFREAMLLAVTAIPEVGPGASAGLRIAVQAAKTVADYGGTAADYMGWFSKPCGAGTEDIQAKADEAFNLMSYLPDKLEQAVSLCPPNKRTGNRKNGDPPQPGGSKPNDNKPKDNPATKDTPATNNSPPSPAPSNPAPSASVGQSPLSKVLPGSSTPPSPVSSNPAPSVSASPSPSSQVSPGPSTSQPTSPSAITSAQPSGSLSLSPSNTVIPKKTSDKNTSPASVSSSKTTSSTASAASDPSSSATTDSAEPEESGEPIQHCDPMAQLPDAGELSEKIMAPVPGCGTGTTTEAVATEESAASMTESAMTTEPEPEAETTEQTADPAMTTESEAEVTEPATTNQCLQ